MNGRKPDCRAVETMLPMYVADLLDSGRRQIVDAHLADCAHCERKLAEMLGAGQPMNPDETDRFVTSVVERTSGSVCGCAREFLSRQGDDELDETTRALLDGHMEHCAGCRRFAVELERLLSELPEMLELQPDEAFTREVLRMTSRCPAPTVPRWKRLAGLMDRLLLRPRIAWEAATTMTVILMLTLRLSGTPIQAIQPPIFDGRPISRVYSGTEEIVKNVHRQVTEEGIGKSRGFLQKIEDYMEKYKQKTVLSVERAKDAGRVFKTSIAERRIEPVVMEVVGWWNSIAGHIRSQPENNEGGHDGTSGETGV